MYYNLSRKCYHKQIQYLVEHKEYGQMHFVLHIIFYEWYEWYTTCTMHKLFPAHEANIRDEGKTVHVVYT
jgi:hypothetical protein